MGQATSPDSTFWQRLHHKIDHLYHGSSTGARRFRWGLLAFDAITILYFLLASFYHHIDDFHVLEEAIGVIYLLELLARLRAMTRRLNTSDSSQIKIGAVVLDIAAHTLSVNGQEIRLPKKEYMTLKILIDRKSVV